MQLPKRAASPSHCRWICSPASNWCAEEKLAPPLWQELLAGRAARVEGHAAAGAAKLIFPGAFNPLHAGHRRMAALAAELMGGTPAYEVSVFNVDKPPLDFVEIEHRLAQFAETEPVWLTRAATFVAKAAVFPGATFVVGADTLARIAEPRYYGGNPVEAERAVRAIANQNCRFLVFGRVCDGAFRTLEQLTLPGELRALCIAVPAEKFRDDVSSTALRQRSEAGPSGRAAD